MGKRCFINTDLLPIKLHYIFFYGATAGVFPFRPIIAKSLGINASALGFILLLMYLMVFVSIPLIGYITDYLHNVKVVMLVLILSISTIYLGILLIPPISNSTENTKPVPLDCLNSSQLLLYPLNYNKTSLETTLEEQTKPEIQYIDCANSSSTNFGILQTMKFKFSEMSVENKSDCFLNSQRSFRIEVFPDTNYTCGCIVENNSFIVDCNEDISSCFCKNQIEDTSVYGAYQFWVFAVLVLLAGAGDTAVNSLSDTACYKILGDNPELYGQQRLWATISWGLIAALAGYLNDLATKTSNRDVYFPGFCLMFLLIVIDMMILLKIRIAKPNLNFNICRDLKKIFSSCEVVVFLIATIVVGALTAFLWNYEFWFLQDLGANQTLLGLVVTVQTLAEVPFFFLSGWFIKTFGYFHCLSLTLATFGFRFGFYFLLKNPWLALPIDILQGLTFALFLACMSAYASSHAPPGTEATMMGILVSLFEGLGVAIGSVISGIGFDELGGRNTFLLASIISFICFITILAFSAVNFLKSKWNLHLTSTKTWNVPNSKNDIDLSNGVYM